MKRFLIVAACFALGGVSPALAQNSSCFNTQVLNSSGATIRLATGQSYMVGLGQDRTEASTWAPMDNVTVCRGAGSSWAITNTSEPMAQTIMAINR